MSIECGNPPIALVLDPAAEDLTDIPVMVALSTSAGKRGYDHSKVFEALGSAANRKKIAITTDDRTTQCYVEIKEWDQANKRAWLWVRVPALSSTQTTTLYLHYDPNQADNTAYVGDTGEPPAQKVWNAGYGAVYTKPIPATKKTLYAGEVSGSAPGGAAANARVAFDPIDCTGLIKGNGWLKIDLKCDLPENLTGNSQLEITSAGRPDTQEWALSNVHGTYGISTEWRTYYLPLSAAYTTGSELDPAQINYIRWYVWMADGAPATTISWRNAEIISTADLPGGTRTHILLDSTANANHGMVYGATEVDGPLGKCLNFSQAGDSVAIPQTNGLKLSGSAPFTRECFIRGQPTAHAVPFSISYGSPHKGVDIFVMYPTGSVRAHIINSWAANAIATEVSIAAGGTAVNDGEPHYISVVYDGSKSSSGQAIVIDGIDQPTVVVSDTLSSDIVYTDGAPTRISGRNDANFNPTDGYTGIIAYVSLSSVARSPAWIAATNASLRDELITYADPPVVAFTASLEGNTLTCIDQSTGDGITGWLWDFGDGNTSTEQNPVHIYRQIGTYTVTLQVTGLGGTTAPSNGGNEPIAVTTVILRIAVEGDTDTALPDHKELSGGGPWPISPVDRQTHVRIGGRLVVLVGEDFTVHCGTGHAGASTGGSPHIFINGTPVCREGDVSSAPHTMTGITVTHNDHVFDGSA